MKFRWSWLVAATLALMSVSGQAQEVRPAAVPGWEQFIASLRSLPERMLARLPQAMRDDPQVQQEIGRLALEAVAAQSIEAIGGDGDAPQFLPAIGQVLNIGQPNADTIYRSATITPGGSYRITGQRGSVRLAILAQVLPQSAPGGGGMRAHHDLSTLKADRQGRYDVLLSAEKPAGYKGDWWPLNPLANRLMLRLVSSDWAKEAEPTLAIERTDRPVSRTRPAAAALEARLRALPRMIDGIALMFVDHVEQLRRTGYVNKLKVFDVTLGALAGQFYYEGTYDLRDDEALIVESPVPGKCTYRSLILTNEIYETTDWVNNHSSLNDSQAVPDKDGKLRIVISAKDPGAKNWLDTAGYPRGIVQGRWMGCDSQPIPEVRLVKLADVQAALPSGTAMVTPEQRQTILRERRRAQLERPLW